MRILLLFGTRPEAIKMAPVVYELKKRAEVDFKVCVTAQHRELLDTVLDTFKISVDYDLNIMRTGQSLQSLVVDILPRLTEVMQQWRPDYVLVHGDTATTFISSLAAFYLKIPIGHVEAGLRTYDIYSPWPEEANRRLTGVLATFHFAPTKQARQHLLNEQVPDKNIIVTGNTVIDALMLAVQRLEQPQFRDAIHAQFKFLDAFKRMVLVTIHRRENHGVPLTHITQAIRQLSQVYLDTAFVLPLHPNPEVRLYLQENLAGLDNIFLLPPQEYLPFVYLMTRAYFILSDSGGIQEEAPALDKPVLVLRNTTERPEVLETGAIKLVGHDSQKIVHYSQKLFEEPGFFARMADAENPFGDGTAAKQIVDALLKQYTVKTH